MPSRLTGLGPVITVRAVSRHLFRSHDLAPINGLAQSITRRTNQGEPLLGTICLGLMALFLACGTIGMLRLLCRSLLVNPAHPAFHIADDGLPIIVHMDVLDADKLLPAITQASKNLNLGRKSPH